jgi:hypothetical protein
MHILGRTGGMVVIPPLNPATYVNSRCWLKADTLITQSGGLVSTWGDSKGTYSHQRYGTSGGLGIRPTYTAAQVNGYGSIQIVNGTAFYYDAPTPPAPFAIAGSCLYNSTLGGVYNNAAFTFFAVAKFDAAFANAGFIHSFSRAVNASGQISLFGSLGDPRYVWRNATIGTTGSPQFTANTWMLIAYTVSATGAVVVRQNGVELRSYVAVGTTNSGMSYSVLGGLRYGSSPIFYVSNKIAFAEVLICNTVMSASDITSAETYFKNKFLLW